MNEKVTHEIRVIETEDGFRIELKGDKEELRRLMFGGGWGNLRQFFQRGFGRHGFGNYGFGHHGEGPRGFGHPGEGERGFDPQGEGRPGFGHHGEGPRGFGRHWHGPEREEKEKGMPRGGRKRHHYDLGPWWDDSTSEENV